MRPKIIEPTQVHEPETNGVGLKIESNTIDHLLRRAQAYAVGPTESRRQVLKAIEQALANYFPSTPTVERL